jgi:hypothetical protein
MLDRECREFAASRNVYVRIAPALPLANRLVLMTRTVGALVLGTTLVIGVASMVTSVAQRGPAPPEWPGSKGGGAVLLPNGWTVAPAGRSVQVDKLAVGGGGVSAFAGIDGGTAQALGLQVQELDFGLALYTERNPAAGKAAQQWSALSATATSAALVGVDTVTATGEALELFAAAQAILPRVRGLVRISERRWDMVLDRNQKIMLPAVGAVAALERLMALDKAEDLLARDVLTVDLRNDKRPVLRLAPFALNEHRKAQGIDVSGSEL